MFWISSPSHYPLFNLYVWLKDAQKDKIYNFVLIVDVWILIFHCFSLNHGCFFLIIPVLDFWVLGVIPKAGLGETQHRCQSEIDGYLLEDTSDSHLSIRPARFGFVSYISFIHASLSVSFHTEGAGCRQMSCWRMTWLLCCWFDVYAQRYGKINVKGKEHLNRELQRSLNSETSRSSGAHRRACRVLGITNIKAFFFFWHFYAFDSQKYDCREPVTQLSTQKTCQRMGDISLTWTFSSTVIQFIFFVYRWAVTGQCFSVEAHVQCPHSTLVGSTKVPLDFTPTAWRWQLCYSSLASTAPFNHQCCGKIGSPYVATFMLVQFILRHLGWNVPELWQIHCFEHFEH